MVVHGAKSHALLHSTRVSTGRKHGLSGQHRVRSLLPKALFLRLFTTCSTSPTWDQSVLGRVRDRHIFRRGVLKVWLLQKELPDVIALYSCEWDQLLVEDKRSERSCEDLVRTLVGALYEGCHMAGTRSQRSGMEI